MPYKSLAQERFFNANKAKIGASVVNEFNSASKGLRLPKKVKTPMRVGGLLKIRKPRGF